MNCSRLLAGLVVVGWTTALLAQEKAPAAFDQAKAMAEMQKQFMMQFDANQNGKLDPQENAVAQEAMRRSGINMGIAPGGFPGADQFIRQFDRDGDGRLNQAEAIMAQAAWQKLRNHGHSGGPRMGGNVGSGAPPPVMPVAPAGSGKPDKVNPLVKRFDKDGDGKLNAEEKAAAQAELKKDKSKDKDEKPAKKAGK
jgi:hypothetical protein